MNAQDTAPKPREVGRRTCWGLWRRRECWVPTWRGWLLGFALGAGLLLWAGRTIHPFLAVTHLVDSEVLVVEGWSPDYALEAAIVEFKRHPYRRLYVTGGPLEAGAPLSEYKTYAQRATAILIALGVSREVIQAVPGPAVPHDRTFAAAAAFKQYLLRNGGIPRAFNVVSTGPHTRRSWLLYEYAFGPRTQVGILSIPMPDYDARRWWKTSSGVRLVLDEAIAYAYARVCFSAERELHE